MPMPASAYDRRVRIEQPEEVEDADSAGAEPWTKIADVRAQLRDILPGRSASSEGGFNDAPRRSRLRIRYRSGLAPDMRFQLLRHDGAAWVPTGRVMKIISGPAELDRRGGLEFMVEDFPS